MMQIKTYKSILISGMLLVLLASCDNSSENSSKTSSEAWQATVHMSQGSKGKIIGDFSSRNECQMAARMHIAKDKKEAENKMTMSNMSFNCALVEMK